MSLTYKQLIEKLQGLSDEQLSQPVRWWGDERGGRIGSIEILEEDYIAQHGEELVDPRSVYEKEYGQIGEEAYVAFKKGTIILEECSSYASEVMEKDIDDTLFGL